ncbi:beta-1,4 N-acetylgalactosaminyltransferase 1-like [Sphaeramia orbicularis]|uniref:beta-1,4 N-acetylgalactosaminyltransferase 1-like n=1 Tax=Sphaeramia orbicularis TaxID=375764 RepID=UPI00117BE8CD|nr:beta-1,4 N-acetylgalactosaminyltransferase 1-like [Sphaeramia orbicularis]
MTWFTRAHFAVGCVMILSIVFYFYNFVFHDFCGQTPTEVPTMLKTWLPPVQSGPCTCAPGSVMLKDHISKEKYDEVVQRRSKELQHHKTRTKSVLTRLLLASPNSPLQYPIQGFTVRPLTSTLIPGLVLHTGARSSYEVTLNVSKGVLSTMSTEGVQVKGNGETTLTVQSNNLLFLNALLSKVSYKSTDYHVNTGDLVSFQFENHKAVFPVVIKQPQLPVLYDMGTDISSSVTITTKTFLRYDQLRVLVNSIRTFYANIRIIIADDSFEPQKMTGEHILHYIMPPAQVQTYEGIGPIITLCFILSILKDRTSDFPHIITDSLTGCDAD